MILDNKLARAGNTSYGHKQLWGMKAAAGYFLLVSYSFAGWSRGPVPQSHLGIQAPSMMCSHCPLETWRPPLAPGNLACRKAMETKSPGSCEWLQGSQASGMHRFHLVPTGQKSVIWTHLIAREAGVWGLAVYPRRKGNSSCAPHISIFARSRLRKE